MNDRNNNETPACLDEWFETQAAQSPDCLALAGDGVSITYAELNRRANQLALSLRAKGLRPGDGGLLTERSVELLTSILGIWKAHRTATAARPGNGLGRRAHVCELVGAFSHE